MGPGVDGVMDPARIVAHARSMADFDVLCLQEVADNFPELAGRPDHDQFRLLAELLPEFEAAGFAPLEIRDAAGRPKRFGNMILSRFPVIQVLRHTLPWEGAETRNMPRGLIEAIIATPCGPMRIMTTHLEYSHPQLRAAQVEAVRDIHRMACDRARTPREDGPGTYVRTAAPVSAILTGDFNMRPDDPTKTRISDPYPGSQMQLVDSWTALNPTAPHPDSACIVDQSFAPPHCCDYVFVTQDLVPRLSRVVYDTETRVSDHQPILIELCAVMTVRIAQISDLHVSPEKPFFNANLERIFEDVRKAKPDLVLNTGDLGLYGERDNDDIALALDAHRELGIEYRVVPGNHDVGEHPDIPRRVHVVEESLSRYRQKVGEDFWVLDLPGWRSGWPQRADCRNGHVGKRCPTRNAIQGGSGRAGRSLAVVLHKPVADLSYDDPGVNARFLTLAPVSSCLTPLAQRLPICTLRPCPSVQGCDHGRQPPYLGTGGVLHYR